MGGPVRLADILGLLDRVPDVTSICTVDELDTALDGIATDHPDLASRRRIGTSRRGDPLRLLSVGHGSRHALVVGCPHPNEPVGMLTVLSLARLVTEQPDLRNAFDLTWHFIGCIDPDGTRLNERWFPGPYTIQNYHQHFYRPAFVDQPEWTFPVLDERAYFDRMLPETEALARVIDELRPCFQYSLHNADFGGVFFILSRELAVSRDLAAVAAHLDVPLSLGPVDTMGWPEAGPGVYLMPPAEALVGTDGPRHGGSSTHYADRHGTTTLITEVPFWRDERAADPSTSGRPSQQVLHATAGRLVADADVVGAIRDDVEPWLTVPSPLRAATTDFLRSSRSMADGYRRAAEVFGDRPATVAEVFGAETAVHMMRLRTVGVLRRQLSVERAAGNQPPTLRAARQRLDELFDEWCATAGRELGDKAFPLRRLVALQVGAALVALAGLVPG